VRAISGRKKAEVRRKRDADARRAFAPARRAPRAPLSPPQLFSLRTARLASVQCLCSAVPAFPPLVGHPSTRIPRRSAVTSSSTSHGVLQPAPSARPAPQQPVPLGLQRLDALTPGPAPLKDARQPRVADALEEGTARRRDQRRPRAGGNRGRQATGACSLSLSPLSGCARAAGEARPASRVARRGRDERGAPSRLSRASGGSAGTRRRSADGAGSGRRAQTALQARWVVARRRGTKSCECGPTSLNLCSQQLVGLSRRACATSDLCTDLTLLCSS